MFEGMQRLKNKMSVTVHREERWFNPIQQDPNEMTQKYLGYKRIRRKFNTRVRDLLPIPSTVLLTRVHVDMTYELTNYFLNYGRLSFFIR